VYLRIGHPARLSTLSRPVEADPQPISDHFSGSRVV
jgi:hypothetical protein